MEIPSGSLRNSEAIKDKMGHWPSFHDAEIISIFLGRNGPSISLRVLMAQRQESEDTRPVQGGHWEVLLQFEAIENLVLQDFNYQNVIASLLLSSIMEERFTSGKMGQRMKVELCSVFGVTCSFSCNGGSVVSVEETKARLGKPFG